MFEGNAELTTKEILKRFGEIGKAPQTTMATSPNAYSASSPGGTRNQQGRAGAVQHVAQDPMAWQNEASVRHVGAGQPPPAGYQGEPAGSPHRQSQFRYQNQGPLGITGAG
jgi:hypothetical protein